MTWSYCNRDVMDQLTSAGTRVVATSCRGWCSTALSELLYGAVGQGDAHGQNVAGSSPDLYLILCILYQFALLFCLPVLCTGHWLIKKGRVRNKECLFNKLAPIIEKFSIFFYRRIVFLPFL